MIRYTVESDASPAAILVEVTRPLPGIAEGTGGFLDIPAADAVLYHR